MRRSLPLITRPIVSRGLFDLGPENDRCAPQVNERVAYSTCHTPYFTNSGMADTLVVFFFSSQLAGPLNGSAYSVWAFFGVAALQHPSARPWGRVPTPLGDGRVLSTLKLHCRPQKAPRAHVQCSAPAVLLLWRSTPAAQLRRRAPW